MKPFDGVDKWHAILLTALLLGNGLGIHVTVDPNGLLAQFMSHPVVQTPVEVQK